MEVFPNWTFIPIVFFLVILTFILNRTFFLPLRKTLDERDKRIQGARKDAEEIRRSSHQRMADFERRMREARREADLKMAEVKNQALGEKSKLISEQRERAEKMVTAAQQDLREKTENARAELQKQADAFAHQIASHILRRPVRLKERV